MYSDADVTQLLQAWSDGDPAALERLIPLVYDDLHAMASHYFRRESETHTLQPTALVNEVYLRLFSEKELYWHNRRQFFGFAAKLMRHILVDHARSASALKRGNDAVHLSFEEMHGLSLPTDIDIVAMNEALDRLATIDPRQAEIVTLRFYIGLSVLEVASLLDLSDSTVKREWRAAKYWLHRQLGSDQKALSAEAV